MYRRKCDLPYARCSSDDPASRCPRTSLPLSLFSFGIPVVSLKREYGHQVEYQGKWTNQVTVAVWPTFHRSFTLGLVMCGLCTTLGDNVSNPSLRMFIPCSRPRPRGFCIGAANAWVTAQSREINFRAMETVEYECYGDDAWVRKFGADWEEKMVFYSWLCVSVLAISRFSPENEPNYLNFGQRVIWKRSRSPKTIMHLNTPCVILLRLRTAADNLKYRYAD